MVGFFPAVAQAMHHGADISPLGGGAPACHGTSWNHPKNPVVHSFGALCSVRDGLLNIMLLQQINGVLPNLSQLGSPCVQYYKGQCLGGNTVGMAGAPMVWTVKVQAAPPSSQSGASGAYYQSHQAMWWYTVH